MKRTMWAVMRGGKVYMVLPTLDRAETYLGLLSHNGFSSLRWDLQKVHVATASERARERYARQARPAQKVVAANKRA